MSGNKSEIKIEHDISEKKFNDALSYFSSLVFDVKLPDAPESISDIPEVQELALALNEIRDVLLIAKNGDFSYSIKSKGFIFSSLKALQSNLNHLAWIARQVAGGDLEQRVDFMGEFSSAFNSMTKQLASVLKELNEQKEHFSYRALHDPLTGLKNRAYFDEQVIHEIAGAKRRNSLLAVIVIDMDNFKQVNDTFGHHAGDILLIEFAKRLLKSAREVDTVARLGGDEFGMLLPCENTNSKQHLIKIRDRIISSIDAYFELKGSEYKISASIGASIYPYDGSDPQTMINVADSAMYQAKKIDGVACVFASIDRLAP